MVTSGYTSSAPGGADLTAQEEGRPAVRADGVEAAGAATGLRR
jgi:hypothetical protein